MQTLPPPKWKNKQSYSPAPSGAVCSCVSWWISQWVNNCTGTLEVSENLLNSWLSLEIFLGCTPVLSVRGDEGTPGTHLSGDLSLSSQVCLVAHQSNHNFIRKESLLQLLQPQLCSAECLLERWRQNHPVIWF